MSSAQHPKRYWYTIMQTDGTGCGRRFETYSSRAEANEAIETVEQWGHGKTWIQVVWE